jgi:hypothetical protein
MESTLNQSEFEHLAQKVAQHIYKTSLTDGIYKEIYDAGHRYAQQIFKNCNPKIEGEIEARDTFKPIIKEIISKDDDYKYIIKQCVNEYFKTEEFKKISIKMLKNRIEQLEQELYND